MVRHNFETSDTVNEPPLKPHTDGIKVGVELTRRGRRTSDGIDWRSFSSYLPEEMQREFRAECILGGIEVRQGLEQAVRTWLETRQASRAAAVEEMDQQAR
ncbi:hypothetical protein ACODT4_41395 [Streptomyces sp. 2.9]|uniref:hypothetical protein n=1 Tax=Streptomyces tritrimontium TaxID=3406573 RepID=UPI003BB62861